MNEVATPQTLERGCYSQPVDPDEVRNHWRTAGFSFGEFIDPPGQEWDGFVHPTDEFVTVREGRLRVTVGSETFDAEPGDLIFIPARISHSLKNIAGRTTRWFYGYN